MDKPKLECDQSASEALSSQRPLSYYENNLHENQYLSSSNNNMSNGSEQAEMSPTQTQSLNTTVPQNIARLDISGRHAPTRNSLRHSRMIVLNRSGQVTSNSIPPFLKYRKLVKLLLIVIALLGLSLTFLSVWLLLWSPNIRPRDNPYWSAIPIVISSVVGYTFVVICPKEYANRDSSYWIRSVKYISITSSVIAIIASLIVLVFALLHLFILASLTCTPPDNLNTTCMCKSNSTETSIFFSSYHYVDLSCKEVDNILTVFVLYTCAANIAVILLESVYVYLHWRSRDVYIYTKVPCDGSELRVFKTNR